MEAIKAGKAPVDEGTSSTSSQDASKKEVDLSEKPKKNVATPKNKTNAVKRKGPQKTTTHSLKKNDKSSRYVFLFNGYYFSCANYGHMARDCKFVDKYNYQGPLHLNEPFRYTHLFNGYLFLCANYGNLARDCEVFDRYNHDLQNPRSKFARS